VSELIRAFEKGELSGWLGDKNPGLIRSEFRLLSQSGYLSTFAISGREKRAQNAGRKTMLYLLARKVLGKDIPLYRQEIGDCASFGGKNAIELLQCSQIAVQKQEIRWRPVFPPYTYGASRVYVGRGRLPRKPDGSWGDGSTGAWIAQSFLRYGCLFADEAGVPAYSGRVATAFGDSDPRNDLDKWLPTAKAYLTGAAALVRTWKELVDAISNGYPVFCGSMVGFEWQPRRDGFHYRGEKWAHLMCFTGVCDDPSNPYAILQNSWGDVHGRLKDFDDGHLLPPGSLRIRRADAEAILAARDSYAVSQFRGFPDQSQEIQRHMFDLIGK
jgi:hypothetical protein